MKEFHRMNIWFIFEIILLGFLLVACSNDPVDKIDIKLKPYPEEIKSVIGRGLVALPKNDNRIFLSWRLLTNDPENISFHIYREKIGATGKKPELIAQTRHTSFIDSDLEENQKYAYSIRPSVHGKEGDFSQKVTVTTAEKGQRALVFDVGQDYMQARVVTGDLNGDGELDVVIACANTKNLDPIAKSFQNSEDTIKLKAFLNTGELLWTFDLGWGIEAGLFYAPLILWDIDADGRVEVILKTNKSDDPLDYKSERLTVLDGETGNIKNETKWPDTNGIGKDYNSNSRNYLAIAHLNGRDPFVIAARGLYNTQKIRAYDKDLNLVWERYVGLDLHYPKGLYGRFYKFLQYDNKIEKLLAKLSKKKIKQDTSRASHSLPIADVNDDGKEEIFWGEHCIGEDGKDLWVIKDRMPYNGQPDVVFPADIIQSIKGKEIYYCREGWNKNQADIGMLLVNNKGETVWAKWGYTHIDGGWVAKILPNQYGMHCFGYDIQKKDWSSTGIDFGNISCFLWNPDGKFIANPPKSWVWSIPADWDGDGFREICMDNGDIQKVNGPIVTKLGQSPLWAADLYGDQREEFVIAPGEKKIHIYFNTEIMESAPEITLIADRQYRNDLSRTAMGSRVIPTEGGYNPFIDK